MQIGVVFPQIEVGADMASVRRYGTGVEELGFGHVLAYDHVVGADPTVHAPWEGPYDIDSTFHEPFVTFGYLAAITALEFVTGIIIVPQRQTVLVAKQAAEVDILTEGRFRLGVGVGWNAVEYTALGQDFGERVRRIDEQIDLLRRLWTERSVTFDGTWDRVDAAGLSPLPVQRPIPIWVGAASIRGYRRIGAKADGWFPMVPPGPHLERALETINAAAEASGRDPATIGMEGRVLAPSGDDDDDRFLEHVDRWRNAGATHLGIDTMRRGCTGADQHLELLARVADLLQLN